jgi:hypothetical protein
MKSSQAVQNFLKGNNKCKHTLLHTYTQKAFFFTEGCFPFNSHPKKRQAIRLHCLLCNKNILGFISLQCR